MRETELAYGRYLVLELAAVLDRVSVPADGPSSARDDDHGVRVLERAVAELTRKPAERNDRCETVLQIYSVEAVAELQR